MIDNSVISTVTQPDVGFQSYKMFFQPQDLFTGWFRIVLYEYLLSHPDEDPPPNTRTHKDVRCGDVCVCVCACHRDAVKWPTRQLLSQVENETTAALRLSYLHPVAVSDARTFFSSASLVVPLSILERKWRRVVYRGHAVVTGLGRKTSAKSKHKHGAKICHSFISVVS